jgi:hypothetical protein
MITTLADRLILPRRTPSVRAYLRWGVLAGLVAGAAMAAFLLLVGESSIRQALVLEAAHAGNEASEEVFSRGVQVAGGALACVLYGACVGAVFGVAYGKLRARFLAVGGFGGALRLGLVGYLAIVLVPALKYPANPPAVGDPDTIGARTGAFLTLLAASILITVIADRAWWSLTRRGVAVEPRVLMVGGLWALLIGLAYVLWPASPDPVTAPATLIWRFRIASLGGALMLWTTLAAFFGWIVVQRPRTNDAT